MKLAKPLLFLIALTLASSTAQATVLYEPEDAKIYVNNEVGVRVEIPATWTHETSGKVIEDSRLRAEVLVSKYFDLPLETITGISAEGSDKSILIQMRVTSPALPAAQITTRSFEGIEVAPKSALEHLNRYMDFINSMTPVTIVKAVHETELNGAPCAHAAYHTSVYLEGYTYLARYDVYSFWSPERSIDLTIIDDRNAAFKTQNEMDIATIRESFRIT